jgi:hypothetical protein
MGATLRDQLLAWFDRLRRPSPGVAVVSFDDDAVTCQRPDGLVETLRWADLRSVTILTTDQGPRVDDVFWVLEGEATGCVVPSESAGMDRLLVRLQQLPGFDNDAVIRAMGSADDAEFPCWRRPDPC